MLWQNMMYSNFGGNVCLLWRLTAFTASFNGIYRHAPIENNDIRFAVYREELGLNVFSDY